MVVLFKIINKYKMRQLRSVLLSARQAARPRAKCRENTNRLASASQHFLFIFKILWRDRTFEPVLVNFALELYRFHRGISLLLFNCLIVILSFLKLNSIDLLFGLSSLPLITLLIASYPRLLFEVLKWIEAGRRAKYLHTVSSLSLLS